MIKYIEESKRNLDNKIKKGNNLKRSSVKKSETKNTNVELGQEGGGEASEDEGTTAVSVGNE